MRLKEGDLVLVPHGAWLLDVRFGVLDAVQQSVWGALAVVTRGPRVGLWNDEVATVFVDGKERVVYVDGLRPPIEAICLTQR